MFLRSNEMFVNLEGEAQLAVLIKNLKSVRLQSNLEMDVNSLIRIVYVGEDLSGKCSPFMAFPLSLSFRCYMFKLFSFQVGMSITV